MSYDQELEHQYTPSRWCKKKCPAPQVMEEHSKITTEISNNVKKSVPNILNVDCNSPFGGDHKIDIFGTDLPKESPIFIYVHGGYWQALHKDNCSYPVRPLYSAGIKVIIAGYNLAPKVTVEQIIKEIQYTSQWVLRKAAEDNAAGVWVGGHSAGAHLASSLLSPAWANSLAYNERKLLKGLVLISGVYDLTPLLRTTVNDALSLTRETAENCSTWNYFKEKSNVQILVVVGGYEPDEFIRQSREVQQLALDAGNKAEFLHLLHNDHFDIVEELDDSQFSLTKKIIMLIKDEN